MGTPLMRKRAISSRAWRTGTSGVSVTGLLIMPDSLRLTLSTSEACCSMLMFLWMMPRPPSRARATARPLSVTVSMAADRMGMFSVMLFVSWVFRSASRGSMLLRPGKSRTSSKVRASRMLAVVISASINEKGRPSVDAPFRC